MTDEPKRLTPQPAGNAIGDNVLSTLVFLAGISCIWLFIGVAIGWWIGWYLG
jgi:hypothetical protein